MLFYDPARLDVAMGEAGCDALVAATAPNVQYLTGYRKPGSALAVVCRSQPSRPVLIVGAGAVDFYIEDPVDGAEVHVHGNFYRESAPGAQLVGPHAVVAELHGRRRTDASPWDLVAEVIRARCEGTPTIGTDGGRDSAHSIDAAVAGARVQLTEQVFRKLRSTKTAKEIGRLAEVARITEAAIDQSVRTATSGTSQVQLSRAFRRCAVETDSLLRSDSISIDGGAALGNVNVPSDMVEPGSIIRYDVGLFHGGYASDISRCFAFLEPDRKAIEYHAALVHGQTRALEALRPGARASEIFEIAVRGVREAGIEHYQRTHVGHGIGIAGGGYDLPLLGPDDDMLLESGMVLCVETPYYEFGFAGLQVEDMVVVTDDGYTPLTHTNRELRWLP